MMKKFICRILFSVIVFPLSIIALESTNKTFASTTRTNVIKFEKKTSDSFFVSYSLNNFNQFNINLLLSDLNWGIKIKPNLYIGIKISPYPGEDFFYFCTPQTNINFAIQNSFLIYIPIHDNNFLKIMASAGYDYRYQYINFPSNPPTHPGPIYQNYIGGFLSWGINLNLYQNFHLEINNTFIFAYTSYCQKANPPYVTADNFWESINFKFLNPIIKIMVYF